MQKLLIAYLALLFFPLVGEVKLIENGKILDDTFQQGKWKELNAKLQASGTNNMLVSTKSLDKGDFSILATLSIKDLKASASGFRIGSNLLGFDNRSGHFFLEGGEFPSKSLPKTSKWLESNKDFELKVTREGTKLSFFIDGQKLTSFKFHDKKLGAFGFRPHRNKMTVSSLTLEEGKLIAPPKLDYIFACGDDGYKSFRIPSLIKTKKGTILAFAEGRVHSAHDAGDIDLVMKRSEDNGKTWSKLKVIRDIKQTAGNPCPIVDQKTGRIIMVFCEMDHHEYHVIDGKSDRRVFVMYSDDDGKKWSKPKNITKQANPNKKYRWLASGPGVGIQAHRGRLIVPMANTIERTYGVHTIYSDDLGKTWKASNQVEKGCNESQLVELGNGQLMLNMRMQSHSRGKRGISFSKNGGKTWSKLKHDELKDPTCQASIIRYKDLLLFSNPATGGRNGMTIRISKDFGKTWPIQELIYPLSSAYSNLAVTDDEKVLCLFEGGMSHYSKHGIALIRKNLKDLLKKRKLAVSQIPAEKMRWSIWRDRFNQFNKIAEKGDVDLLLIGDSITHYWQKNRMCKTDGQSVWDTEFSGIKVANFGIGSDRTQHLLYRLQNGNLKNIQPKAVVLMIGTNNTTSGHSAYDIYLGTKSIIEEVQKHCPKTKIFLYEIFPRIRNGKVADENNKRANKLCKKLCDGKEVIHCSIYSQLLDSEEKPNKDIFFDGIHVNADGYKIWAKDIKKNLADLGVSL